MTKLKKFSSVSFLTILAAVLMAAAMLTPRPAASAVRESLTGAAGCESADSAPPVSADNVSRHVAFLASDKLRGRRAGTPDADEAARYIVAEFRKDGLTAVSNKGFLQPFRFVAAEKLGSSNSFRIGKGSAATALAIGVDFMPLAFSSPRPVEAKLLYVGYGISAPELQYDNYGGADAAGKIVVILRGSPDGDNPHGKFAEFTQPGSEVQFKTLKAREKGAIGVIFVSDEEDFHQDALFQLRFDLNFLDAGIPAVVISRKAARSLFDSGGFSLKAAETQAKTKPGFADMDTVTAGFRTDVVRLEEESSNVIGMIKGSDPALASQYVVIGAHYDHLGLGGPESLAANPMGQIHHGADDNASGTAALLELARVLNADRTALKRSVVFIAFSGEEEGLLGSAAYTRDPAVPLAQTVAMLNMDMIGRLRDRKLVIGGAGTSPAWKPLFERINDGQFDLSLQDDGYGPSDHQSFYIKDIPVLFFFTGSHDDYHKPTDTADKVNATGIKQVSDFVARAAIYVAGEPQRIAFTKVKRDTRSTGGFRVYLGTVPNYSDQADGLKLDGVRPGSPAERAGIKAGDIVVKLGTVSVKNVYDYTFALGELKGGEPIDMVVRRDGKEMTLKITPEKRQ